MAERFVSVVLDGHKGLAFQIPFDPAERWGVSRCSCGRGGGVIACEAPSSVVVSRARKFFVLVTDQMKKAGKFRNGSSVRVSLSQRVAEPAAAADSVGFAALAAEPPAVMPLRIPHQSLLSATMPQPVC